MIHSSLDSTFSNPIYLFENYSYFLYIVDMGLLRIQEDICISICDFQQYKMLMDYMVYQWYKGLCKLYFYKLDLKNILHQMNNRLVLVQLQIIK